MKISYNWLKEFIDISLPVEETARLLTGSGLEVEGIEYYESLKGALEGIVIGEVKTKISHPNADKLSITTVNIGGAADLQIVCGAPNVAAGQKVLVATVGSTVHPTKGEPFKINKSKIRGEVSEGMICAEDELGLGESHDGILILPSHYEVGKKAIDYFPVYTDHTIEIGLTANRGDAASHLGVARDLKALTHTPLKPFAANDLIRNSGVPDNTISVEVQDLKGCIRYSGIAMSNITVKESPDWLKNRLKTIGLSPINNIVDITNYVLHSLGQPLHAFDADKITGRKIVVKNMPQGTKFTTLDKTERTLNGNECMICDEKDALAIGGIFGGLHSGITADTKNIFVESACFNPETIRKSAKYHALSTDASFRFERGTDPNITIRALGVAVNLIKELAGGEIASDIVDVYPAPVENVLIRFSIPRFNRLIGQEIPIEEVKRILQDLEILIVSASADVLELSIPPFRVDVKREADVAEEILRIYGLNKIHIPAQLKSAIVFSEDEKKYDLRNQVADMLGNKGFLELINNSLTKSSYYNEDELKQAVSILNPLSNDLDIMRMNMLYTGLEVIQYNINRKNTDLRLFEFGYTYHAEAKHTEHAHLAIFIAGNKTRESWKAKPQLSDYFTIKTALEMVLKKVGVFSFETTYTGQNALLADYSVVKTDNIILAEYGSVKDEALKKFDLDDSVFYADIKWDDLLKVARSTKNNIKPVSAFPSVRRDLALLIDNAIQYADIERIAYKSGSKLVRAVNVFDVYQGDKIEAGKKSYAISITLQDDEKTLTDGEIEKVMKKLIGEYEKQLGARLRG